jgi:hypothetical protein
VRGSGIAEIERLARTLEAFIYTGITDAASEGSTAGSR